MNSKLFGGILLVTGTSIGAGMLALPPAMAGLGFWGSILLLTGCWAVMAISAFLFLEVNLAMPANSNLISMAGATLGMPGQITTWFVYLVLLYSILSAYVSGGGDLFHYLLNSHGLPVSMGLSSALFTLLLGAVVYFGIRAVDYVNRGLMSAKMGAYLLLVVLILPFVSHMHLNTGEITHFFAPSGLTVGAIAFGNLMIIPTLRDYFGKEVRQLKLAIFIGSIIPLFCYIAWNMVIMGVIPTDGGDGLVSIAQSNNPNSSLVSSLNSRLNSGTISFIVEFFTSICMVTTFLSISLCLSDFLADGLKMEKKGPNHALILALTFLPPLFIAIFMKRVFLEGLRYAGISCIFLMILLPALMVWRYYKNQNNGANRLPAKTLMLFGLMTFSIILIIFGLQSS